ncbi:hypothetical protein CBL_05974 [Carabus blaptoides fortunei]
MVRGRENREQNRRAEENMRKETEQRAKYEVHVKRQYDKNTLSQETITVFASSGDQSHSDVTNSRRTYYIKSFVTVNTVQQIHIYSPTFSSQLRMSEYIAKIFNTL